MCVVSRAAGCESLSHSHEMCIIQRDWCRQRSSNGVAHGNTFATTSLSTVSCRDHAKCQLTYVSTLKFLPQSIIFLSTLWLEQTLTRNDFTKDGCIINVNLTNNNRQRSKLYEFDVISVPLRHEQQNLPAWAHRS